MGLYHNHNHAGHDHHHSVSAHNKGRVGLAALITGLFMIAEVIGGLISGSLALLADAGHMLTDFAALGMAWGAFVFAARPANARLTFGYERLTVLVAFVNGLTLFILALWIVFEAVQRFQNPSYVLAGPMFAVAVLGLIVNIFVFRILSHADQDNLNVRGAVLHVLGDLLGSVAAIMAALIIWRTGWMPIDPLLSVLVALLILRSAWFLIKDSAHILLEGAPKGLDREAIRQDLMDHVAGLEDVQHMHIWSLSSEQTMATLEVIATNTDIACDVGAKIKSRLKSELHIGHATVEVRVDTTPSLEVPCDLRSGG